MTETKGKEKGKEKDIGRLCGVLSILSNSWLW